MDKKVTEVLTEVVEEFCQHYCKYPEMETPEGKSDDWLTEDEDSPCNNCPFMRI